MIIKHVFTLKIFSSFPLHSDSITPSTTITNSPFRRSVEKQSHCPFPVAPCGSPSTRKEMREEGREKRRERKHGRRRRGGRRRGVREVYVASKARPLEASPQNRNNGQKETQKDGMFLDVFLFRTSKNICVGLFVDEFIFHSNSDIFSLI